MSDIDVKDKVEPDRTEETGALPRVFSLHFSVPGLVVGALFFAFSLFSSLLPRTALFQGIVSGIAVAIGYGIGAGGQWVWNFLSMPEPRGRTRRIVFGVLIVIVAFACLSSIWQHVGWQNDVRSLFGMDATTPIIWPVIIAVTLVVAALLLIIARSVWKLFAFIARLLSRFVSIRFAQVLGAIVVAIFLWLFFTGVLEKVFFGGANQIFSGRDSATPEGATQPTSAARSGSEESLAAWDTLGRQGRRFVGTGPTVEELEAFNGESAVEPVRVYAGLKSADTLEDRAVLVLDELKRTGAFDREVLVVATTTGTGFLQPQAVETLEYIHNGDTAIAGVQYSYLPSWISLLADQEAVQETSRVVFDTIHDYWSTLPESERPELYLYGLSLGSFGVEAILSSIAILNEPIDGAFMSGPPFVNDLHAGIVEDRDPGSAASLPVFEEGRTVRFTAKENALDDQPGEWGPTRVVYLQHASDPVVFFSQDLAFNPPDWLEPGQRGPDVSKEMLWTPIVTMFQVAMDLPAAGSVPEGFGHLYAYKANADSWVGLTEAEGWPEERTGQLADHLTSLNET